MLDGNCVVFIYISNYNSHILFNSHILLAEYIDKTKSLIIIYLYYIKI